VLDCELDASQARPLTFPPSLRRLLMTPKRNTAAGMVSVLSAVGQLQFLEHFDVSDLECLPSAADLQPLQHLTSPCVLTDPRADAEPSAKRELILDSIRSLTQLRYLIFAPLFAADVRCLLQPPHQLQVEELGFLHGLDDAAAALLPSLPSLQRLSLDVPDVSNFAFIGQLPQLRELSLTTKGLPASARAGLLASAAAGRLAHLRALELSDGELSAEELVAFLAGMPQLSELALLIFQHLQSLRFLSAVPRLAVTLTELQIPGCRSLPLDELEHLYGLKKLRMLNLFGSFAEPLPRYVKCLFTPGASPL